MTENNPQASETFCDGCGHAKSDVELRIACDGTLKLCSECFEQARMILYTQTSDHRIPVVDDVRFNAAPFKQSKIGILDSLATRIRNALSRRNRRP